MDAESERQPTGFDNSHAQYKAYGEQQRHDALYSQPMTPDKTHQAAHMEATCPVKSTRLSLYLVTRRTNGIAYGHATYRGFVCSATSYDCARFFHPCGTLRLDLANQCSIDEWDARTDWVNHLATQHLVVRVLGPDQTGLGARVILADYMGDLRQ